jgi:hypothetical protein
MLLLYLLPGRLGFRARQGLLGIELGSMPVVFVDQSSKSAYRLLASRLDTSAARRSCHPTFQGAPVQLPQESFLMRDRMSWGIHL